MNRNYKEFNQIPKRNNTLNMNSRSNNNIPNQIMKRQQEEKNDLFTKKIIIFKIIIKIKGI
jgi:hypothetical protein